MKTRTRFILLMAGLILGSVEPMTDNADKWLFWTVVVKVFGVGLCYFAATFKRNTKHDTKQV